MSFEIKEKELVSVNPSDNTTEEVLFKFVDDDTLKDTKYNLYAYVDKATNGRLYVKFGECPKSSPFDRYNTTGHTAAQRMICVWTNDCGDDPVHSMLKGRCNRGYKHAEYGILNTDEAYEISNKQGLFNLINDINEFLNESSTVAKKEYRKDYQSTIDVVNEVLNNMKDNKYFALDLCARFGKTGTFLRLARELSKKDIRIMVMASYVGTVKHSYSDEILTIKNNECCKFIDPDSYESTADVVNDMKDWLSDNSHYIMYYVALTGDENGCFERRVEPLKKFDHIDKSMVIEEADFGSTCDKQVKKIKKLADKDSYKVVIATTGTKIEKTARIFENAYSIKRDYILDVIPERSNAVGIDWTILRNNEMVKKFGYDLNTMENFNDMMEIVDRHMKEETYFKQLFNFLFNHTMPVSTITTRKYEKHKLLNEDAATIIFLPMEKDKHEAIKKLLEETTNYAVMVINGDETTNAHAEVDAKQFVKDATSAGKKVIFLASNMANRSFSVPEIKNVILLTNAGDSAGITQKVARGLTPWKDHDLDCKVIDFRLQYDTPNLAKYISSMGIDTFEDNSNHTPDEIISILESSEKLHFNEYFGNGEDPLRSLTSDELKIFMQSPEYKTLRAVKLLTEDINTVDLPNEKFEDVHEENNINSLIKDNAKGNARVKVKVSSNGSSRTSSTTNQDDDGINEEDQRIQYLFFLINHKELFNSGKYENDILRNEFRNNMTDTRKKACERYYGIDMETLTQIVDILIDKDVKLYD